MSGYYTERTLQQVPIPDEIHSTLKSYAKDHEKTMNEVYDDMVEWFLKKKKKDVTLPYIASPRGAGKYKSLWLNDQVLDEAKETAKNDSMSVNRIIYSAMAHYLNFKKYH